MMNNLVNFYLFTMLCNIFVIYLCYFSAIKSILKKKKIVTFWWILYPKGAIFQWTPCEQNFQPGLSKYNINELRRMGLYLILKGFQVLHFGTCISIATMVRYKKDILESFWYLPLTYLCIISTV